jgi:hypothetical protein
MENDTHGLAGQLVVNTLKKSEQPVHIGEVAGSIPCAPTAPTAISDLTETPKRLPDFTGGVWALNRHLLLNATPSYPSRMAALPGTHYIHS